MNDEKILLERKKHFIYIKNAKSNDRLRYNLKEWQMEKKNKKTGEWRLSKQQYKFFRAFSIKDVECEEEKFKEMLKKTKQLNPFCYSLSTFFSRLNQALAYENYSSLGVKTKCYVSRWDRKYRVKEILTKPVEFYHKDIINFFKKYEIEVTPEIEKAFIRNYQIMKKIIYALENSNIEDKQKINFFEECIYSHSTIINLVREFNYDLPSLINYLFEYLKPFENLDLGDATSELYDYYRMAKLIGRNVKKYPKYLRSMHDIITANYNAYQKNYNEDLFYKLRKSDLEHEGKKFSIVIPSTPKEIIKEGTDLNHCVGSYIDKILKGETYIFFLRLKKDKEKSLITLEIIGKEIINAKGSYNRPLEEEERDFLETYCKIKNLKLNL